MRDPRGLTYLIPERKSFTSATLEGCSGFFTLDIDCSENQSNSQISIVHPLANLYRVARKESSQTSCSHTCVFTHPRPQQPSQVAALAWTSPDHPRGPPPPPSPEVLDMPPLLSHLPVTQSALHLFPPVS